jgi:hypothetical protein
MTWAPGQPMIIKGRLIEDGGWIERDGSDCFNLYRPPTIELGDATKAGPWVEHVNFIYPAEAYHIIPWLAHRAQRPGEKINHAMVLGGDPVIGKDTMLEPAKLAIGHSNFADISPKALLGRFNKFAKSVIIRISEARDLGEFDRFAFYEAIKTYAAAPPDVIRVDEKHLPEYAIPNCCGVIITTNHKCDGIFLPADDRRHFVAWSERTQDDFTPTYWNKIWNWYQSGGFNHVAAYLASMDLSAFDPKAPPPKTQPFWDIADSNRAPEEAEIADVIERRGNPKAFTLKQIQREAEGTDIGAWLSERKNRRAIPHRLEKCGYVPVRNTARNDGLWIVTGERQVIYAQKNLPTNEKHIAAQNLTR